MFQPPVRVVINDDIKQPSTDNEEMEAKGFTPSTTWVTESSSVLLSNTALQFNFRRVSGVCSFEGKFPLEWMTTFLDTEQLLTPAQFRHRYDVAQGTLDLRNLIFGSRKGVCLSHRVVGRCFTRCSEPVTVVAGEQLARTVTLQLEPFWATAFADAVNAKVFNARRSLSAAFIDATNNLIEITEVCRHGREILNSGTESTRYLARLAAMIVETAIHDACAGHRLRWDIREPAPKVSCGTWTSFRKAVLGDSLSEYEMNYIPWWKTSRYTWPQEIVYARVLRFAAGRGPMIVREFVRYKPLWWPEIPNCVFYTSVVMEVCEDETSSYAFSLNDVYVAARFWAERYSEVEILDAMIQQYILLYWADKERQGRLVLSSTKCVMELPRARMRGYVMAPYLAARDNITQLSLTVGPTDMLARICEATILALLIGFGSDWVRWHMLDYALLYAGLRRDARQCFSTLIRRADRGTPIWAIVSQFLQDLGYEGDMGRYFSTLSSGAGTKTIKKHAELQRIKRISSLDLLGWYTNIPSGSAAQGWIKPVATTSTETPSGNEILFCDLPSGRVREICASAMEICDVSFIQVIESRDKHSVNMKLIKPQIIDSRGFPTDNPLLAITLECGSRKRFGLRYGLSGVLQATQPDADRFNLKWWITRRLTAGVKVYPIPELHSPPIPPDYQNLAPIYYRHLRDEEDDDSDIDSTCDDTFIHDSTHAKEPTVPRADHAQRLAAIGNAEERRKSTEAQIKSVDQLKTRPDVISKSSQRAALTDEANGAGLLKFNPLLAFAVSNETQGQRAMVQQSLAQYDALNKEAPARVLAPQKITSKSSCKAKEKKLSGPPPPIQNLMS